MSKYRRDVPGRCWAENTESCRAAFKRVLVRVFQVYRYSFLFFYYTYCAFYDFSSQHLCLNFRPPVVSAAKNRLPTQETWVLIPGQKIPWDKESETHASIPVNPMDRDYSRLQSMRFGPADSDWGFRINRNNSPQWESWVPNHWPPGPPSIWGSNRGKASQLQIFSVRCFLLPFNIPYLPSQMLRTMGITLHFPPQHNYNASGTLHIPPLSLACSLPL